MITSARRYHGKVKTLLAFVLLFALLFTGNNQHALALQPMDKSASQSMYVSCASYCAGMNKANPNQSVVGVEEARVPDPFPDELDSFGARFLCLPALNVLNTQAKLGCDSFRPPDLVIRYVRLRL